MIWVGSIPMTIISLYADTRIGKVLISLVQQCHTCMIEASNDIMKVEERRGARVEREQQLQFSTKSPTSVPTTRAQTIQTAKRTRSLSTKDDSEMMETFLVIVICVPIILFFLSIVLYLYNKREIVLEAIKGRQKRNQIPISVRVNRYSCSLLRISLYSS
ncbi:hypothetical protein Q1695_013123 [Nippostrongylus brasiliensis]|nr:hypothetical protein Q1695_013123 [Nippostrongylus brasiliensis]